MAGNHFGQHFVLTTCGESHGPGLMAIIDGCPPGLPLSEEDFAQDIDRRRTGSSRFTSQRHEEDKVEIISGVFEGKTTGTPIGLLIRNTDQRPRDYAAIKDQFRPGHADFTYQMKYGFRDYRGGGRASARETVMRVAAGVIAKKFLHLELGVEIRGCVVAVGDIEAQLMDWDEVESNPFYFPDAARVSELEDLITNLRREGDSVGALLQVEALSVPVGLGEPVFAKLSADLAAGLMGINAVKAVEIGQGMAAAQVRGTEHRDVITGMGMETNRAGGVLGGISTGEPIVMRLAFKPTSSITTPVESITASGEPTTVVTKGRHDPCVGIRAVPIAEAMMALVLMDHYLRHRGQVGS